MSKSARCCSTTVDARLAPPEMDFLPHLMDRRGRYAVPTRSALLYAPLGSRYAAAFTLANANSSVPTSLVLPSILVRAWPRSRAPARCWSHRLFVTLWPVPVWSSRTVDHID